MIQAYTPIFKTSAKIYFISIYGEEVSVNVNHSVFHCHYHCPSPSPCGVAGAGVTFCPEAPALSQY